VQYRIIMLVLIIRREIMSVDIVVGSRSYEISLPSLSSM
jgi:hypothetical protein